MKKENNKNQNPIGTPNPKNPNILEWVSEDGERMLQYISSHDYYRFCRAVGSREGLIISPENGAWIVEPCINGLLSHHLKTLNK